MNLHYEVTIIKYCPRCGAALAERTNRQTGETFLGCTQYPLCTHTEPIPESVKLRRAGQKGMFDE